MTCVDKKWEKMENVAKFFINEKKTFPSQNGVKLKNFLFLTYRMFSNLSETDVIDKSNSLRKKEVYNTFVRCI